MKKFLHTIILVAASVLVLACNKEDNRYLAPYIYFEDPSIYADASSESVEVKIMLSQLSTKDFDIELDIVTDAENGREFTMESESVQVEKGREFAVCNIGLNYNNISSQGFEMKLSFRPSGEYAVSPDRAPETVIKVSKTPLKPILTVTQENPVAAVNPCVAPEVAYRINLSEPLDLPLAVEIKAPEDFTVGKDFTVNGTNLPYITVPANTMIYDFTLGIGRIDQSGFDRTVTFEVVADIDKVETDTKSFDLRLYDPVVDFSGILINEPTQGGNGFAIQQAIMSNTGDWDGRTLLNLGVSSEGSNYLRSYKNIVLQAAWDCMNNAVGGDVLRISGTILKSAFPTKDTVLADYGSASTNRFLNPSDSLFRFIPDPENPKKGTLSTVKQEFSINYALKSAWESGSNPNKPWQEDSRITGGDITKSTFPFLGTIDITLEKIEGTYDFTLEEPSFTFKAWFSSASPFFMRGVDPDLKIERDGEYYIVEYKLYPKL